jgi:hypothetical protein
MNFFSIGWWNERADSLVVGELTVDVSVMLRDVSKHPKKCV